ncbi:hypothetical protein FD754_023303 [Muntiacus muntjak]|uniref:Lipocalin/cytosolic fatty-acid binding domain-containing protein n=1 Tax=Muntiacus muntjak TaxID=9888 RepID=A0A5N3UTX1_MUNMU|nr:hypothetical protein FD754_023306 [Muntiacus muntjak]KAB0340235.1 hypothetical protein FD754_023305 [Muntiacus muntjak]KAB0340236.1 hypothetical protein FD754_023304 [Muntiacus muntjak]KAB0340237.1 hypothetical protein FD754_023303 [Muntiacus muntjak]
MKAVFLTLLLGLVCVGQEASAQPEASEITGEWYTIYMAADNKEKIEEGGPLRTYFRRLECIDNCEKLSITIFLTNNGSCTLITAVAQRAEGNVYRIDYVWTCVLFSLLITNANLGKTFSSVLERFAISSSRDIPHLGIKGISQASPALAGRFFTADDLCPG